MQLVKRVLVIVGLCLLAALTNVVVLIAASGVQSLTHPAERPVLSALAVLVVALVLAMLLFSLWNRLLLRRQLPSLFGAQERPAPRLLLGAVLLGLALPGLVLGFFAVTGWGRWTWFSETPWWIGLTIGILAALLPGVVEEIAYRWFLYGALKRRMPRWAAILVVGLVFGALHLTQVSTLGGAILLLIAALLVSFLFITVYERTGSIWCAAAVHMLWDLFIGQTGMCVVNSSGSASDCSYQVAGMTIDAPSKLLSGGDFGVDASLPAMALYLSVGLLLLKRRRAALSTGR